MKTQYTKAARTMQDAFGHYTSQELNPMNCPHSDWKRSKRLRISVNALGAIAFASIAVLAFATIVGSSPPSKQPAAITLAPSSTNPPPNYFDVRMNAAAAYTCGQGTYQLLPNEQVYCTPKRGSPRIENLKFPPANSSR